MLLMKIELRKIPPAGVIGRVGMQSYQSFLRYATKSNLRSLV